MTDRALSKTWVLLSIAIFTAFELVLGIGVAWMLEGKNVSHMLGLRIELFMSLASFFVGGFVVGLVSPGPRLTEPAIGAAVTVVFTFLIAFFTPVTILAMDPGRILIGGTAAFLIAMFGAHLGERITGN